VSNDGNNAFAIVTGQGSYYFLYSPPSAPASVVTVDKGTGTATSETFAAQFNTTFSPLEYINAGGSLAAGSTSVKNGSLSSGLVPQSSLTGSVSYTAGGSLTHNLVFVANSAAPRTLASIAQPWSGNISHSHYGGYSFTTDWKPVASFTVTAQGALSGTVSCHMQMVDASNPSCGITGTLTPRTDMGGFDISFSFTEANGGLVEAAFRGKTITGIAFHDTGSGRFRFVGATNDNTVAVFSS
jgi:hypothetical protein